ncbi:MAG: GNAT family N-acetyltransferase [Pseudomonadota bacterium]|uniref:GNAT family N-acetyltransferase n=1 Tax=Sphingobium xenophagum TaxID=121428 RepID=A0A249MVE4_SPHXE|nr:MULTISPECIES: GNAT family N-acetyltransferase [Sphingobium]ASY45288.1 GNAT family N-acetyltransferase [Sphingobium xenophagum]OUC54701.1 GNAT family N-acetyltransferase [Sphingobium sp. GW456-12-10-14-TSB1]QWT14066.1 GNAT family N-acetyltransferase [Sphingobium xenophagum]
MAAGQARGDASVIRAISPADHDAIWAILEPVIRAGETLAIPRDMTRQAALSLWLSSDRTVRVLEEDGAVLGIFYVRANQMGGGAHVANAGYVVAQHATGRGVARRMCAASLDLARALGFRAMQFNFVVSSNVRAVALWQDMGFAVVGRLPEVFDHPALGYVDALVMFRAW